MMSRKDYIVTAKVMADCRMTTVTDEWVAVMHLMIKLFKKDNPRFDEARFREACYQSPVTMVTKPTVGA